MPAIAETPPVPDPEHRRPAAATPIDDRASTGHRPWREGTERRRVWRCAPSTIVLVAALMLIVGIAMPAAAAYSLFSGAIGIGWVQIVLVSVIGVLALLSLFYGWRLALHPRILIEGDMVVVINPFRQYDLHFDSITLIAPGGDGLLVATRYETVEAWCVQKSALATRSGRRTRADRICDALWDIWEEYHAPTEIPGSPVRLRFVRPGRHDLLAELEQSASMARLSHIFPPEQYPFPIDDVSNRWRSVLIDPTKHTLIAELDGEPVGYAAFDDDTVLHLGVHADHQRRGIGSALLTATLDRLNADTGNRYAYLWVLEDNHAARDFYTAHDWMDTGETRTSEFEPHPTEIEMAKPNPRAARRSR